MNPIKRLGKIRPAIAFAMASGICLRDVGTGLPPHLRSIQDGKPIEVNLKKDDTTETVAFSVKDHGMGISSDFLPRIFKRFERGVVSAKISGLGLGLYICQKIVQAHGGSISVDSELGKGSTFCVRLPWKEYGRNLYELRM